MVSIKTPEYHQIFPLKGVDKQRGIVLANI